MFIQISIKYQCLEKMKKKTTFIVVNGLFCYVSMPYDLKNALPTFVCAIHKTFDDLIRHLVEMYVDDIVVKIKSRASPVLQASVKIQTLRLD
jgi:hypothetical protein